MSRPKGSKNKPKDSDMSIVTPIIKYDNEPHPLEDMEKNGEMPILKSVGVARVSENSREWISYVITSQGSKVLNIEVSEPDSKAVSADMAKVSFINTFANEDGALHG